MAHFEGKIGPSRLRKGRVYASVSFNPCGAEKHSRFEQATLVNGRYVLDYPYVGLKAFKQGKSAQAQWALDAAKHLRSWLNSEPQITVL